MDDQIESVEPMGSGGGAWILLIIGILCWAAFGIYKIKDQEKRYRAGCEVAQAIRETRAARVLFDKQAEEARIAGERWAREHPGDEFGIFIHAEGPEIHMMNYATASSIHMFGIHEIRRSR